MLLFLFLSSLEATLRFDAQSLFQALDKIRFLSLTDKEILGEGDDAKLEIQVCTYGVLICSKLLIRNAYTRS